MAASIDAVGNTVGRYEAAGGPGAPALLLGSHIDTVRNAGRYDGNLGVVVAIEAVAALHARGERLPFAVEVIAFGDEEGVRFPVTLTGSHAVAGTFDPAALAAEDEDRVLLGDALRAFGCDPAGIPRVRAPARGRAGLRRGPHRAGAGPGGGGPAGRRGDRDQRRQPLHRGRRGHGRPRRHRADGRCAATRWPPRPRWCCWWSGRRPAPRSWSPRSARSRRCPGAVNVIPAEARFTIDIRSPSDEHAQRRRRARCARAWRPSARRRGVGLRLEQDLRRGGGGLRAGAGGAARGGRRPAAGIRPRRLPSGAGHDGLAMVALCPIGMLFVRCAGGISHNPAESITTEDADVAVRVLLDFLRNFRPAAALRTTAPCRTTPRRATPHEARIRAFLDGERAAQAAFLAELVKVPSDNPPGDCAPARRARGRAAGRARLRGRAPSGARGAGPRQRHGQRHQPRGAPPLRRGGGPVIALNAHGDVVPPGEGWTRDPYGAEVVDGWMYGRGVAVSKSDFATYAWALRRWRPRAPRSPARSSCTSPTTRRPAARSAPASCWSEGISRPDLALSAGFSYGVVTAHNGCLHLEVEVNGRSAHAAMPYTGVDALEAATAVLAALYAWRKGLGASGLGDRRHRLAAAHRRADQGRHQHQRRARPDHLPARPAHDPRGEPGRGRGRAAGGDRRGRGGLPRGAGRGAPHPARRAAEAAARRRAPGRGAVPARAAGSWASRSRPKGVPLYTDARHYAARGIPIVLYGAGPRTIEEANAHRADERLPLDDLRKATEVVALTLARPAGAGREGSVRTSAVGFAGPHAPSPRGASRPVL